MKKILFLLTVGLIFINICNCQIKERRIAEKQEIELNKYDSTLNYLGSEIFQYIGQELYVKPQSESLRKFGYKGFFVNYQKGRREEFQEGILDKTNIYACCDSYNSKYNELAKKTFVVLNIVTKKKTPFDVVNYSNLNNLDYEKAYYLKLLRKDNNDTVYYHYDGYEHNFNFLVLGYVQKLKNLYLDKKFLILHPNDKTLTDINTGNDIKFINGSFWKCIDIVLEEKYYNLVFIFENEKKESIYEHVSYLNNSIYEKSIADKLKSKFGSFWKIAIEGNIKVGMTKEMVIFAWGEPKSINDASYGEQWVYENQYVYFKNGKVTSWN